MANQISSIDDLLMGITGNTQQPQTPENIAEVEKEVVEEALQEDVPRETLEADEPEESAESAESAETEKEPEKEAAPTDEYGNELPKPRTYSEDEVNERINMAIRERLARMERNSGQQQRAAPQQSSESEQGNQNWQQELEQFIGQTLDKRQQQQAYEMMMAREQQAEAEFEAKFQNGMRKFPDFVEKIRGMPITDDMVRATRTMRDPAAFFYAAAQRMPTELQEISRDPDPISQIAKIAKLEEKLKTTPMQQTKAPKPVSKVKEDVTIEPKPKKREPTIDDLIAQKDKERRALLVQRRRGGF